MPGGEGVVFEVPLLLPGGGGKQQTSVVHAYME